MVHLAYVFDHQVRRTAGGWACRHAATLSAERLDDKLETWLTKLGIETLDDGRPDARLHVFPDDAALLEQMPTAERPATLVPQAMTATLVASARPLPTPILSFPDRGVTLAARAGNTVLALVSGEQDVDARLATTLGGPFPMKRLATTRYRRLVTADGAPFTGRLKPSKLVVIAGLGDASAFFAPALARALVGQSTDDEKRWFAERDPSRPRDAVVEFVP
jgi:hypothetical protein